MRWTFRLLVAFVLFGVFGVGALLLASPSVDSAKAKASALAAEHGINFPSEVPPAKFAQALIATEDKRFFSPLDPGIDSVAVMRVIFGRLAGFPDQGGSTIDQQLAKMLFSPRQHGLQIELERMGLALKLNATYGKSEILAMYAQAAYYGHGYYGLQAASCGYFGKRPAELNWSQAAMLAGAVNAPSIDDPILNPSNAYARMKHVLGRLVAVGDLTSAEADAAKLRPLGLTGNRSGTNAASCRSAANL